MKGMLLDFLLLSSTSLRALEEVGLLNFLLNFLHWWLNAKQCLYFTEGHRSGLIPKPIIPIDDIGNIDPPGYAKGEKEARCKLAALYRLIDHFGWSQSVYNHITVSYSTTYFK